jgi:hypothetical protein
MVRAPGRLRCGPSIYPTEQDAGQGCVGKLKVGLGAIPLKKSVLNDRGSPGWGCAEIEERLVAHVAKSGDGIGISLASLRRF